MSKGLWLTQEQVRRIRERLTAHHYHYAIADEIGVDRSVVTRIANGHRRTNGLICDCGKCRKCKNREATSRRNQRRRGIEVPRFKPWELVKLERHAA